MAQATATRTGTDSAEQKALPIFTWSGKTKAGEQRSGEMEGRDAASVEARLRQAGIEPTKVKKKPKELSLSLPGMGGVGIKDILVFTRQLSVMIDAGLPLVQGLEIIGNQAENPAFRKVLKAVKGKVESGSSFADGLADHPKVFDELFVQLVRAGEIGGILDTILQRLGAYIEKNDKLARRVKGAMVYPAIVLSISIGVVAILIGFVVPTFEKMFKDMGGSLPPITQVLIDISHGFRANWYLYFLIPTIIIVAFKSATKKGKGQEVWHGVVIKTPGFGALIRKVAVARFTRTLGTMLSSGVPILDAFEIVARTAGNKVIEKGVMHVRAKISEGKNIAGPLAETGVFPRWSSR